MMALLQSAGYTYSDVKALYRSVKKQWIPKINEKYYYITDIWEIDDTYNDDYRIDKERIKNGNCFKTLKEAQTTLNKIRIF